MKTETLVGLALAAGLCVQARAAIVQPRLEKGDRLVICGDSITYHAAALPFGYYHQLTNVFAQTCPGKKIEVAALGFSGSCVSSWIQLEKTSRTKKVLTHCRKPGWDVADVLSNRVDALVVFLGMNDILAPYMGDASKASADRWEQNLTQLVQALRDHAKAKKIVLCTTTPLTADAASPKNVVRLELGKRLRKVAAAEGCGVAEFGRAVMDAIDDSRRVSTDFQPVPDFVHPMKLGHIAMAREICRAFGESAGVAALTRDYAAELVEIGAKSTKNVAWRLHPLTRDGTARELAYRIEWFWHDTKATAAGAPSVKAAFALPDGWSVVARKDGAREGEVTVRGVPDRLVNPVEITLTSGSAVARDTVAIPTPWRLSAGWDCPAVWRGTTWLTNAQDAAVAGKALKGPWSYVTGTYDYKGGIAPGSIDPFQVTFGTSADSVWVVRNVWSEKDRDVTARLSHATFSLSGGFTLYVNGTRVFADYLNRNGRNKLDVPAFHLRRGLNEIRLRVDHRYHERQFAFDLVPVAGDDLSALRYRPCVP